MKAKLWIVSIIVAGVIFSCGKDLYTTAPQLKFESVNGQRIPISTFLSMNVQVTDKEGDIQDTIWVARISYNKMCPSDTTPYQMPAFSGTKDLKATINVKYYYGSSGGVYSDITGCEENDDSCYFRFWIHDNAQHTSDTVRSPDIVLLKN